MTTNMSEGTRRYLVMWLLQCRWRNNRRSGRWTGGRGVEGGVEVGGGEEEREVEIGEEDSE